METKNIEEEKRTQSGALKMAANFLIIIAVAVTVLFFLEKAGKINLFSSGGDNQKDSAAQTLKYYNDLQEKYKNDTYGGATPAETLKLFIAALKAGDTELASKYFIIEKQAEWKKRLDEIISNKKMASMISDLLILKLDKEDDSSAFFILTDKNGLVTTQVVIRKISNGKWKLESL